MVNGEGRRLSSTEAVQTCREIDYEKRLNMRSVKDLRTLNVVPVQSLMRQVNKMRLYV